MDTGGLRELYDTRVRGLVPEQPPVGAVVRRDGPLVRTHYGTHGTVGHARLTGPLPPGMVRRQAEAFAARREDARWQVHGDEPAGLAWELEAAGFEPGPERSVLAAAFDGLAPPQGPPADVRSLGAWEADPAWWPRLRELAAASGPHPDPLDEFETEAAWCGGRGDAAVVLEDGRPAAAGWARVVPGTDVVAVGGLTSATHAAGLVRGWRGLGAMYRYEGARYCCAEVAGEARTALLAAGFAEVATVRTFTLTRQGAPGATTRPVLGFGGVRQNAVWDRLWGEFGFRTKVVDMPGFAPPAPCATWPLGDPVEEHTRPVERAVRRALTAATAPGDRLYWMDWQHPCSDFDPHRVGRPGQPPWPGWAFPNGDFYLYLDTELRFGTFGHPWEPSLTVFGDPLLAAAEADLTRLLGEPLRRRD
ncbi:DUF2716 domain-containing protein [Streptomyces lavendulae]|uniref:DUF2716 domain-containing protein n=1 Tax=Streptomyces lavendulae TaxID=1914 RepID=UPI0024A2BB52|nr:DUF2716 domain-containing protein [Streptomyces lavendulae]GLX23709.1 hypothetical protein Slala01_73530 [Streptomyces lavendulae subsp. lavendulae]GLX31738.1 hypothetical protein Slala02_75570 [Streptomyces lavendulae subsp. lavendulae]